MTNFDQYYATTGWYYGSPPSEELAEYVTANPRKLGKALDLGCGEGRDSVFLARHGYDVVSIDQSPLAIAKLHEFATMHALPIKSHVADVTAYEIESDGYDLISLVTVLDHVTKSQATLLAKRVINGLKVNGIVFAEVFTKNDPGFTGTAGASETSAFVINYFEEGELRDLFSELEIIQCEEKDELDETHGPVHRHSVAILISRRR